MKPTARRWVLAWLLVSQLLEALSIIAWAMVLMASWPALIMAFDAGFSKQAVHLVVGVLSYPLLPLACSVGAWVCYALRQNVAALVLTTLPLLVPIFAGNLFFSG